MCQLYFTDKFFFLILPLFTFDLESETGVSSPPMYFWSFPLRHTCLLFPKRAESFFNVGGQNGPAPGGPEFFLSVLVARTESWENSLYQLLYFSDFHTRTWHTYIRTYMYVHTCLRISLDSCGTSVTGMVQKDIRHVGRWPDTGEEIVSVCTSPPTRHNYAISILRKRRERRSWEISCAQRLINRNAL